MKKAHRKKSIYGIGGTETVIAFLIGTAAGAAIAAIMFPYTAVIIVFSLTAGIISVPVFSGITEKRRRKIVRAQFKDFLDSLCSAFSGGCNARDAFARAYADIKFSYGENGLYVREAGALLKGVENGQSIESQLPMLAERINDSSFSAFAETFTVCTECGGNLKNAAAECRDIINGKIEAEREIAMCTSSNRNELNILTVMPFAVTLMMKDFGSSGAGSVSARIVSRIIALTVIAAAYAIGLKITDIKV